jgi:hypothetical protein
MTPPAAIPISSAAAAPSPPSPWRSYAVWSAVAVFILSRIYLYGFMIAGVSDVSVYFRYVVGGVDLGKLPYRDIPIEYPPVAYWTISVPRALSDWRLSEEMTGRLTAKVAEFQARFAAGENPIVDQELADLEAEYNRHLNHYDWGFRFQMLAADIVAFVLFGLMFVRRHPALVGWGLWTYVVSTVLLGYLLYDRLDIGLTMLLLVWAYCWLRADGSQPGDEDGGEDGFERKSSSTEWLWSAAGYAALGLGIGYKLIPVIVVPFALLVDLFRVARPGRDWRLLVGPVVLVITALGPFAWYYHLVGEDLGRMFAYHADRGLQIESSYVMVLMLAQPWSELVCYYNFGSWNLRGDPELTGALLKASTWLLLAVLAILGLRSFSTMFLRERYDRTAAVRMGVVAVAAATLLAKVLSPQYLIWSLPMLVWGAAELLSPRWFKIACVGAMLMAACTSFLFPCHYLDSMVVPPYHVGNPEAGVKEFKPYWSLIHSGPDPLKASDLSPHWLPPTVLIVRNVIMALLTTMVVIAACRKSGFTTRPA